MLPVPPIERVSSDDLMSLATERGSTPMQVGAVLMLDDAEDLDPALAMAEMARRVTSVPRLRQRLVRAPWGCGRPIWVDDGDFTVANHFSVLPCPAPGGDAGVMAVAAEILIARLPRDRPLWSATLVTGTGQGGAALIVVFHHVLADGVGGLAVLARLADGIPAAEVVGFPGPMPSSGRLAIEAARDRTRSLRNVPEVFRRLRSGSAQLRPVLVDRLAPSSLNVPTGPRRQFATVLADLSPIRDAAHEHGATLNDALLSAVAAALHRLLLARGEWVDEFVLSVPFSKRRGTSATDLGNQSGVVPVAVPGVGDPAQLLGPLAETTRAAKQGQRGASTALLSPFFRLLGTLGLYRWFIDRQRLIHTFVSNVHGPESHLTFMQRPITNIIPISAGTGNVTVSFAAMSYAGRLAITIAADPDACPDLAQLQRVLEEELHILVAPLSQ